MILAILMWLRRSITFTKTADSILKTTLSFFSVPSLRSVTILFIVAILAGSSGTALANKSSTRVQRRSDTFRAEREAQVMEATVMQTPWSASRIRHEVIQRYPAATAVGSLALRFGVDDPRLAEFVRLLQPELAKLDEMMSRPVFYGYQLPNEIGSELATMRGTLGRLITDVYGENVRREVWTDLHYTD